MSDRNRFRAALLNLVNEKGAIEAAKIALEETETILAAPVRDLPPSDIKFCASHVHEQIGFLVPMLDASPAGAEF